MSKPPLTPTGVQSLLDALYALPDVQLQQEANALESDFANWLATHFELTDQQAAFIENELSDDFISFVSLRVPFVMIHRLPITYSVFAAPPEEDEPEWGKIVTTTDNVSQSSPGEAFKPGTSGSFQFISRYYKK